VRTLELPFGKSPEEIIEREQEDRPRRYAKRIFKDFREHERIEQVDRLVPAHLRDHVRFYLRDWAMREKNLKAR